MRLNLPRRVLGEHGNEKLRRMQSTLCGLHGAKRKRVNRVYNKQRSFCGWDNMRRNVSSGVLGEHVYEDLSHVQSLLFHLHYSFREYLHSVYC